MTEPEVFILAEQALRCVIDSIKEDQWALITPADADRQTKQLAITSFYHSTANY